MAAIGCSAYTHPKQMARIRRCSCAAVGIVCFTLGWQGLCWSIGKLETFKSKQFVHNKRLSKYGLQPSVKQLHVRPNQKLPWNGFRTRSMHLAASSQVTETTSANPPMVQRFLVAAMKTCALWGGMWLWFIESMRFVTFLATKDPRLEMLAFAIIACFPLLVVQDRILSFFVPKATGKTTIWNHILQAARMPYLRSVQTIVLFLAINILAVMVSPDFTWALPSHLKFIDPNGDGILSAFELKLVTSQYSIRLVSAILGTCLGAFFWAVKKPPADGHFEVNGLVTTYWDRVRKQDGRFVLTDLGLTWLAAWLVALRWFRFFGLNAQTVLTFGGIGGLAFGLASQNLVGNVMSGLLILLSQPFKVGDFIETEEASGYVKKIGWQFIEIETKEGPIIRVPNSHAVEAGCCNRTTGSVREVEIEFPVRFPPGGFARCKDMFKGLGDVIKDLPICGSRVAEPPEVFFAGMKKKPGNLARVKVSVLVDNKGLGETDDIESELHIAAMDYMMSQGVQIPGLELEQ